MEAKREKDACRALALSRRRAQSAGERHAHSLALCRLLESLPELRDAKTVLGYIPAGSECDLRPLYETLRRGGVTLAFPVTAADGIMEAYVPGDDLVPGLFGVPEPDPRLSRRLEPEALAGAPRRSSPPLRRSDWRAFRPSRTTALFPSLSPSGACFGNKPLYHKRGMLSHPSFRSYAIPAYFCLTASSFCWVACSAGYQPRSAISL